MLLRYINVMLMLWLKSHAITLPPIVFIDDDVDDDDDDDDW